MFFCDTQDHLRCDMLSWQGARLFAGIMSGATALQHYRLCGGIMPVDSSVGTDAPFLTESIRCMARQNSC